LYWVTALDIKQQLRMHTHLRLMTSSAVKDGEQLVNKAQGIDMSHPQSLSKCLFDFIALVCLHL